MYYNNQRSKHLVGQGRFPIWQYLYHKKVLNFCVCLSLSDHPDQHLNTWLFFVRPGWGWDVEEKRHGIHVTNDHSGTRVYSKVSLRRKERYKRDPSAQTPLTLELVPKWLMKGTAKNPLEN